MSFSKLTLKKTVKPMKINIIDHQIINPNEVLREVLGPSPPPIEIINLVTPGSTSLGNQTPAETTPSLQRLQQMASTMAMDLDDGEKDKDEDAADNVKTAHSLPAVHPRTGKNLAAVKRYCQDEDSADETASDQEEEYDAVAFVELTKKRGAKIRRRIEQELNLIQFKREALDQRERQLQRELESLLNITF